MTPAEWRAFFIGEFATKQHSKTAWGGQVVRTRVLAVVLVLGVAGVAMMLNATAWFGWAIFECPGCHGRWLPALPARVRQDEYGTSYTCVRCGVRWFGGDKPLIQVREIIQGLWDQHQGGYPKR